MLPCADDAAEEQWQLPVALDCAAAWQHGACMRTSSACLHGIGWHATASMRAVTGNLQAATHLQTCNCSLVLGTQVVLADSFVYHDDPRCSPETVEVRRHLANAPALLHLGVGPRLQGMVLCYKERCGVFTLPCHPPTSPHPISAPSPPPDRKR